MSDSMLLSLGCFPTGISDGQQNQGVYNQIGNCIARVFLDSESDLTNRYNKYPCQMVWSEIPLLLFDGGLSSPTHSMWYKSQHLS